MEESKFVLYMKRKTALTYGIKEIERIIAAAPQNKWFTLENNENSDFWQNACRLFACAYRTTPLRNNDGLEKIKYSYYYNDDMNYRALYRLDEHV